MAVEMISSLPTESFDFIAAYILDLGYLQRSCKQIWPRVARYPRTSSWSGSMARAGMHQLTSREPWDEFNSPRVKGWIMWVGQHIREMEVFGATSKSVGRKLLQYISNAVNILEYQTDGINVFLTRNHSSFILSCVLTCSPFESIDRLNGNHPKPNRSAGYFLGSQSEGNILHVAVAWRAEHVVRVLLDVFKKNKMELDSVDSIAETPLLLAVKAGNEPIVSMLLEANADVNTTSGRTFHTPLHVASMLQNARLVKLLLKHCAEPNAGNSGDHIPSPLMAMLGDTGEDARQSWNVSRAREILALLIDNKADVNGRLGRIDATSPFRSSVFVAARDAWRGILDLLLQRRGDVNAADDHGDGPLHVAVHSVQELLDNGATGQWTTVKQDNGSVLWTMDDARSVDSVQQLLDNGADINQADGAGFPAALGLALQGWSHHGGTWQWNREMAAVAANMRFQEDECEEDEGDECESQEDEGEEDDVEETDSAG